MKYYDCHFHLPNATPEGFASLISNLKDEGSDFVGGNLVLNSQPEIDLVYSNIGLIPKSVTLVPLLDKSLDVQPEISKAGWYKIHPALQKISKEKIPSFINFISTNSKSVKGLILHYFPWGKDIQYCTSLEILIALVNRFPKIPVMVSHGGGYDSWVVRAHTTSFKNIYYDFSVTLKYFKDTCYLKPLQVYLEKFPERVLFGSDWPWGERSEQLKTLAELAAALNIPEDKVEKLILDNALRLWKKE